MSTVSRTTPALLAALTVACLLAPGCKKGAPLEVRNPDYVAWASFKPGSFVTYQGTQTAGGKEQAFLMTDKLISKDAGQVVLERTMKLIGGEGAGRTRTRRRVEKAKIHPTGHPSTHPGAKIEELGETSLDVGGVTLLCRGRKLQVRTKLDDFVTTEQDLKIETYRSSDIPGALVKASLETRSGELQYELRGHAVQFQATVDEAPRP